MKLFKYLLCLPCAMFALDLTHINDYLFLEMGKNVEFEGFYQLIGNSDFRTRGFTNQHIRMTEAGASFYAGGKIDSVNAICAEIGYNYLNLDWKQNPRFTQRDFNDIVTSVAFTSTGIKDWRWILEVGAQMNLDYFSIPHNTTWTGVCWGRYAFKPNIGVHFGFLGNTGVKYTKVLPIIGMDMRPHPKIQMNAVFPLDFSFAYLFNSAWRLAAHYRSFGGWWKANHRIQPETLSPQGALVTQSASGADLGIYYKKYGFSFSLFGGYTFQGWLLVQNPNHSNYRYYKFKSAPYVGAKAEAAF